MQRQAWREGEDTVAAVRTPKIGQAMKACRQLTQTKQDTLAHTVGLASGAVIAAYEAGDKQPTLLNAMAMAQALGVSTSQFVGEHTVSQLPLHVTNNANGDHQHVYQHVQGGAVLIETVRQVVREELARSREALVEELLAKLQAPAEADDERPPQPEG